MYAQYAPRYPFCYQCAKNYQSRWKFNKVMAKTIVHSFFETRCIIPCSTYRASCVHYSVIISSRSSKLMNDDTLSRWLLLAEWTGSITATHWCSSYTSIRTAVATAD